MSNHHYLDYLDLAKGFGICLVVLGHSRFPLHFAIDIFHMPLFFVLAGMTFTQPAIQSFSLFFIKKVDRILVPWVFFSILSAVVAYVIHWNKPTSFNAPLWFLQTYFCSIVIYTLLKIYCNRFISIILISLIFIFSYTDFYSNFIIKSKVALSCSFYILCVICDRGSVKFNLLQC